MGCGSTCSIVEETQESIAKAMFRYLEEDINLIIEDRDAAYTGIDAVALVMNAMHNALSSLGFYSQHVFIDRKKEGADIYLRRTADNSIIDHFFCDSAKIIDEVDDKEFLESEQFTYRLFQDEDNDCYIVEAYDRGDGTFVTVIADRFFADYDDLIAQQQRISEEIYKYPRLRAVEGKHVEVLQLG